MTTWILTIGNQDVQLNSDEKWTPLFQINKKDNQTISIPREFNSLENKKDKKTNRYIPSARVMGQLYGDGGAYYENIVFPLLDVFKEYFKQAENPIFLNYVYLVLSDQSSIFPSEFY